MGRRRRRRRRSYPSLRAYRTAKGLTQEQAGEQIGISQEHWNHIENGYRRPSLTVADRIVELTGVSLKSLLAIEREASAS